MGKSMREVTLFSWGYWGWGNATPKFVEAVDAVERRRGFGPPVFVDVRISRSVRAVGFRDGAFARTLGGDRYVWMQRLGNQTVRTRTGPPIQIKDPKAAENLLELALDKARAGRRILYFCACEWPALPGDDHNCHRVTVAELVLDAARRRGVGVEIVEWPGGEPGSLDVDLSPAHFRLLAAGAKSVPLPLATSPGDCAGTPWGSVLCARSELGVRQSLTGPVRFERGLGWYLPVLGHVEADVRGQRFPRATERFRREHGLEPRRSADSAVPTARVLAAVRPARELSEFCVYTISHRDKLSAALAEGGSVTFRESRRWTTAAKKLQAAIDAGEALSIVFADAANCSALLYWARLREVALVDGGTRYTVEQLAPLDGRHSPQDLQLASTGRHIAPDFIRPYAICKTPEFLVKLVQRAEAS